MSSKLITHGGKNFIRKVGMPAGAEPFIYGGRQHWRWYRFVNCRFDGPSALAGIRHAPLECRKRWVLVKSGRCQIQQPGRDDATVPPDFRDLGNVEIVLIVLRVS